MKGQKYQAIFLTIVMLLSGCLSSEPEADIEKDIEKTEDLSVNFTLDDYPLNAEVGEFVLISGSVLISPSETDYSILYDIVSPTGIRNLESSILFDKSNLKIIFSPDEPGEWSVIAKLYIEGYDDPLIQQTSFTTNVPDEGDSVLVTEAII